ncbi:serine hydrolase [Niallia sp. SS-2023]|nr:MULTISPECIES: serine hydrolase [unclassified Niallia]MCE4052168.1 D-alanyl-D-alanine carboxypeptidase [Bacillus sp. Au-Bac7]MCM3034074.1 D-alanyl-D-alanine carboxypeptidase [Niallia sp. MER 6]MDL0437715.1 serine hydrolase [Niallia sp. SS-2023]UPO87692.1 D-alanyl-D-alanine carboxypeptidase [Niallia sp. Man26]
MMQLKKWTLYVLMAVLFVSTVAAGLPQQAKAAENEDTLGLEAGAAILVDAATGEILYEKNADKLMGVASMSKMMTEYIVLEAIKEGKISWDQKVKINNYIHRLSGAPGLSNIGLTEGEEYTVKELYQAMGIFSGNAATVALAELIAGTEKNYINVMNEKAEELGLKDYKFVNSSGLNNSDLLGNHPAGSETDENEMSAKTVASLAYHLLNDYPEVLETSGMPRLKFRDGRTYDNFNWLLPSLVFGYEGADGLKTGSTDYAGYNVTATAKRGDQRVIAVIMKSETKNSRFTDATKLLNYGFNNFSTEEILPAGYTVKGNESVKVTKGKEDSVKIQTSDAVNLVIKKEDKENYVAKLVLDDKKLNSKGELAAPVKKGDKVGYITLETKDGKAVPFLTSDGSEKASVDVVAAETVEKANWFVLAMRGVGSFFANIWDSVSSTVKGWF